jgi:G3E family GTPase
MTKTDVVSGFLGAGKTTLISKLINLSLEVEHYRYIANVA